MADLPLWLQPHKVTVKPFLGSGPYGDVYGDPVEVRCFRDERRQIVRNANGDEVVSEVSIFTNLKHGETFKLDSRVEWDGRTDHVISVSRRDDGGLGAWQHLEVAL